MEKDIWEENWKQIVKNGRVIDLSLMKRNVMLRSKAVLKQIIEARALEA